MAPRSRHIRATSIGDVAQRIGVSIATVSRALNPRTAHLVSARTLGRIRAAANEMNYRPNVLASALMGAETRVVGVLTSEFKSGHTAALVGALQDELYLRDYWPMIAGSSSWQGSRRTALDALVSRKVDGLIILPALIKDPVIDEIVDRGIPAVVVYGRSGVASIPSVTLDDNDGMRNLVYHLADLGHQNVICVTGPLQVHAAASRTAAFVAACRSHRRPRIAHAVIETDSFEPEAAVPAVKALLARQDRPTAIVAVSDTLALGCIDELGRHGWSVPEEMSVSGYGDIPMMGRLQCPLTTVAVPAARIGQEAARCLMNLLGGERQKDILLHADLVVRKSTGAPRPVTRRARRGGASG